jgi:hypothetical protein
VSEFDLNSSLQESFLSEGRTDLVSITGVLELARWPGCHRRGSTRCSAAWCLSIRAADWQWWLAWLLRHRCHAEQLATDSPGAGTSLASTTICCVPLSSQAVDWSAAAAEILPQEASSAGKESAASTAAVAPAAVAAVGSAPAGGAAAAAGAAMGQGPGLPTVRTLSRLRLGVDCGWPLCLMVSEEMLLQHNAMLVLLLQVGCAPCSRLTRMVPVLLCMVLWSVL